MLTNVGIYEEILLIKKRSCVRGEGMDVKERKRKREIRNKTEKIGENEEKKTIEQGDDENWLQYVCALWFDFTCFAD